MSKTCNTFILVIKHILKQNEFNIYVWGFGSVLRNATVNVNGNLLI